jgi:hypothetical protein
MKMERHEGTQTAINIALLGVLYLSTIMDLYDGPQTVLNIALLGGLFLAIKVEVIKGPKLPHYRLAWCHLLTHYNAPV